MFHLLYLAGVETENETLWFNKQPAHILGVYTDHQQLGRSTDCRLHKSCAQSIAAGFTRPSFMKKTSES